jgi:hypothetical protein
MKHYDYLVIDDSPNLQERLDKAAAEGYRLHSVIQGRRAGKYTYDNPQVIMERELVPKQ